MKVEKLFVESGVRLRAFSWMRGLAPSKRVILVSEPGAWRLIGAGVKKSLQRSGLTVLAHLLPSGEAAKTWGPVSTLLTAMLTAGLGRDSALVALGGGSVTDAAGFAAAIYQRGIPWVSVPTTLLGQIDSGLGGKTGINLAGRKNSVGCFHRPRAVVCDPEILASLPRRERVSGLGEALKYGLVFEPALWGLIVGHWDLLLAGDSSLTGKVVARCAAWKRQIVDSDERETLGPRELLNFGHTLGHALESVAGLGVLRHGEAVIWGMRAALRLSQRCSGLNAEFAETTEKFLAAVPVPLPRRIEPRRLLNFARRDKKARGGRARFVLLRAPGRPVTAFVPDKEIARVIRELL